ncbi:MAG: sigma-70 family RNA polymerase sigma factor [Mediterranea sp.]|jgi:RNA polymerase sigma-70 factor (ECF subfamily)|nr:sigma-70 family RNA polymerase sigma factor [Mediterranea sp.]
MEEKTFWNRIQQGDEAAFRQLYEQYSEWLYGYGMKIVGNEDMVSEAIQTLFVYIFEKRTTCAEPDSIPAYLCVSLRHILIGELRKNNNRQLKSIDDERALDYDFDLEIDVEEAIIRSEVEREQLELLQKELNGLTKQQREVIYLRYYKKLSPDEIADVMGLTSRTVYNTTHTAMTRLRKTMGKASLVSMLANLIWIIN